MPAMEGLYAKSIDNPSHFWRLTKIPAPATRSRFGTLGI
jgi:hypothetical protein